MKQLKKFVSVLLTLVMVLAMGITAFADEISTPAGKGNFTITLNSDKPGHSYSAYQIFKGDLLETTDDNGTVQKKILSNIEWGTGIDSDRTADLIKALQEDDVLGNDDDIKALTIDSTAAEVAETLVGKDDDGEFVQAFADVVSQYLSDTISGSSTEIKDNDGKTTGYEIQNLTAGYYLVKDNGPVGADDAISRYILQVVSDVEVDVKAEIPTVEKKILEGTEEVDANNASVGSVVSYQITGKVPDYTGYDKYYYVINDTLSVGLTFNNDITVKIKQDDGTYKTLSVVGDDGNGDYYLYTGGAAAPYTFQIAFKNIKDYKVGAEIVVEYFATVNANAETETGKGETNKVSLTYSNDPNSDENGEDSEKPGTPDEKVPTGETPDDITITYVAAIEITKTDENKEPLAGAEFTLTGTSTQTVLKNKTYYEIAENGEYYLLKDGTYTKEAPRVEEKGEDGNVITESNEALYVSTTVKYTKKTTTETKKVSTPVKMVAVSDEKGNIIFSGLGEGTYTIEETKVPSGYNKAKNMTVVISCTEPEVVNDGNEKAIWSVEGSSADVHLKNNSIGVYTMTIVNKSGPELPSTGGRGTTVFYVLGSILVIGAAILLVTKRRMNVER